MTHDRREWRKESAMPNDTREGLAECRTRIFSEGDYITGTLTWGWQCFACGAEGAGLGSATGAGEAADEHGTRATP